MNKIGISLASIPLLVIAAGAPAADKSEALKEGQVVTYTLSSDTSVRKVGTIVDVDRSQAPTIWYSISTTDMYCGKDRDVVRSDYVLALGGSSNCNAAGAQNDTSIPTAPANSAPPNPAAELTRRLGKIKRERYDP